MEAWSLRDRLAEADATQFILSGILILISVLVIRGAVSWYRLSHVPGPLLASISSLWAYRSVKSMAFHRYVRELREKHGGIVRISPDSVMISDSDTLWRINSARSSYSRGAWYGSTRMNPWGDSVFSEMDTVKHDKRKAKLAFGFSGKGLMDLEGNLNSQLGILIDVLKMRISQGQGSTVVDLGRILQFFQVDLITIAGMGKAWGDLATNQDRFDYLAEADRLFPYVHSVSMIPWLRYLLFSPMFLAVFGSDRNSGWLGALADAVKQRKQAEKHEGPSGDMLDEWLKHGITPEEAELDLSIQVPAGTETSITVIRALMLYLMVSPAVYQKVKREISDGIHQGRISNPVTNEEARNLPYLQAVINEGMRVGPPLTAGFPKQVPPGGDIVCGKALPEGTQIWVDYLGIMNDQEVFGSDVDIFRPERFLECDAATRAKRMKVVDLIFGYGRWQCLGKVLAVMEMNKIFVELFRSFDFQVVDPEKPWDRKSTVTWYIHDFNVRVTEDQLQ